MLIIAGIPQNQHACAMLLRSDDYRNGPKPSASTLYEHPHVCIIHDFPIGNFYYAKTGERNADDAISFCACLANTQKHCKSRIANCVKSLLGVHLNDNNTTFLDNMDSTDKNPRSYFFVN